MKRKYTKDQLRNHFERVLSIQDSFHSIHVGRILKKYPEMPPTKIINVVNLRAYDFVVLEAIEEIVKASNAAILKRHNLVETI